LRALHRERLLALVAQLLELGLVLALLELHLGLVLFGQRLDRGGLVGLAELARLGDGGVAILFALSAHALDVATQAPGLLLEARPRSGELRAARARLLEVRAQLDDLAARRREVALEAVAPRARLAEVVLRDIEAAVQRGELALQALLGRLCMRLRGGAVV